MAEVDAPLIEAKRELLERYLRGELRNSTKFDRLPPITCRTSNGPAPLSFAQQQVWIHSQLSPELPIYNEPFTVHRRGPLNVTALERALTHIIRRHEAWRTTFPGIAGQPVQVVGPPVDIKLALLSLCHLSPDEREVEALRIAAEDARRPFDLARGPLMRAKLVQVADAEYRLYLTVHQIILDGITAYQVFLPELTILYEAFAANQPCPLDELPFQSGDFACWQREWLAVDGTSDWVNYWCKRLSGELPTLNLPTDRPRPGIQTFRGAMYPLRICKPLVEQVRSLSQREGATLFMGLLSGFYALLRRYTGQNDLLMGTVIAGRKAPQIDRLLGYFVNPVVLRTNLAGDPSFRELLHRVRETVIGALSHDALPFEYLIEKLQPQRDLSRNPLFQIMMSLEPRLPVTDGWSITQFDVCNGTSKFDLYFDLDDREEGIIGPVTYSTDLFDESSIDRMVGHWKHLLQTAVADPSLRLSELPLLTPEEEQQLVVQWNDTAVMHSERSVPSCFEAQVERTPDCIAVEDCASAISYRELNRRANQLARHLRVLGVAAGTRVGICTQRTQQMLVALLGVLKAGGAYVPLDPSYPRERLDYMLKDSGIRTLLTEKSLLSSIPANATRLVCLSDDWERVEQQSTENLGEGPDPDDLAYVIYTSGSTGRPKGVQITHRGLTNVLLSMQQEPGLTLQDTLLAVTTLSFDIAALELFLPLITGARLVLAEAGHARDGEILGRCIARAGATVMQATPATWRLLLEAGWQGKADLRVWCGGEALGRELAEQLLERCQSVWNLYGPTETTIWSAVSRVRSGSGPVDLGHPVTNTQFYVLDTNLQLLPVGVPGELHIGGCGLARGYLNQPELTGEKFVSHPFCSQPGARLYKTGDLVRRRTNGELEFLGRIDHQVKVRGFRIELEEIENALLAHRAVKAAVVDARCYGSGEKQLTAYVVGQAETPTAEELREFLSRLLPEYMLPAHFVSLESLPLTPNGKVNRRALPELGCPNPVNNLKLVLPGTQQERKLAQIWEEVLGISPLGVNQNFFDVGGHSLLAAKLIARVQRAFGKQLVLADIFTANTIAQMSALLNQGPSPTFSGIIPIQPQGSMPPLFWVRGGALFRPLARRLGPDQPSLGLHLPSQEARCLPSHCTLQQLADAFVRKLRQAQPKGPYYLAGLCVNGVLAYEMACQLAAQRQPVALLAMVDAQNPTCYRAQSLSSWGETMSQQARFHWEKLLRLRRADFASYLHDRVHGIVRRGKRIRWKLFYDHGWSEGEDLQMLDPIVHPAATAYIPHDYDGNVVFFQSTEWPAGRYWDLRLGWKSLVKGRFDCRMIEGAHESIFHEPNVDALAVKLMDFLPTAKKGTGMYSPEYAPNKA